MYLRTQLKLTLEQKYLITSVLIYPIIQLSAPNRAAIKTIGGINRSNMNKLCRGCTSILSPPILVKFFLTDRKANYLKNSPRFCSSVVRMTLDGSGRSEMSDYTRNRIQICKDPGKRQFRRPF